MSVNHPAERTEVFDYNLVPHRKKVLKDFTSSRAYSDFLENMDEIPFRYETVDAYTHQRPDLFSNKVYQTPHFWWWLILFNSMTNPATEFVRNTVIKVPMVVPEGTGGG